MKDRVPLYPGRVKLTPVAGQENVYDMVRADQPTQEGTPLNKNSLLKDATAALFQLSGDTALPDKVFEILSKAALVGEDGSIKPIQGDSLSFSKVQYVEYNGTGLYGASNPCSLTFDGFRPDVIFILGHADFAASIWRPVYFGSIIEVLNKHTSSYKQYLGPCAYDNFGNNRKYSYAKYDDSRNTLYWYSSSEKYQLNENSQRYFVIALKG